MPSLIPKRRSEPTSLFGEILDWMLAPLLLLWPLTLFFTYQIAAEIAHRPYDQALAERARWLQRLVTIDASGQRIAFALDSSITKANPEALSHSSFPWLLPIPGSIPLLYEIRTPNGRLAGNAHFPPPLWTAQIDVYFQEIDYRGEAMRLATLVERRRVGTEQMLVAIQVAESLKPRQALVTEVITGVMIPQFLVVPIAVVLVWFGLTQGLAPLRRLQAHIARRRPTDLSPIDPERVPEEIRPLIEAFNRLMARLEENLTAQRRFIADAAHQMRTPITGLKIQAELARDAATPEELRHDLEGIVASAERAARLINQLLTLARTESSSELVHRFEPTDLVTVLREAVAICYPKAQCKAIGLALEAGETPVTIEANALMLGELFKNLIDNAITYTPAGGEVTVRLQIANDEFAVHVDDTGPGIPSADRERVFAPFVRLERTAPVTEGSGLGLAIVREIAEQHRARVAIATPPSGKGTRVTVLFARSGVVPHPNQRPAPAL